MKRILALVLLAVGVAACDTVSYVQTESPANKEKDYRQEGSSVLGVGEPISKRQMRANAVLRTEGTVSLEDVMARVANTYNVAIRWGDGVDRQLIKDIMIADLTFNEARSYIEDVYRVQIVREGERRLLVLPSADLERIQEFSPGTNVALVQALRGLAQQCNVNLVITENRDTLANTFVTTTLRNITCPDAFDALLAPHGLSLKDNGDYFSIGGLPQRSWNINLYEPLRSETQRVNYSASVSGAEDSGSGSSSSSSSTSGNDNVSGGSGEVVVREERDLWAELENDLNTLLNRSCEILRSASGSSGSRGGGSSTCGYVRVNRSVGAVEMQAPRGTLMEANRIIRNIEEIAGRRMLVEARVIAVTRDRSYEQEAQLGALLRENGRTRASFGFGPSGDLTVSAAINAINQTDIAGGFAGFDFRGLAGAVRFIESFGTAYQLMQPTMEVMDRQRAIMIDGRNERYFVRESEVVAADSGNIVNTVARERSQFVGIQFAVSAQIANGDEPHTVALQIPITDIVRFVELNQTFGQGDGQPTIPFTDLIPVANTRLIDQKVRIRDGEVKAIGGLTRTMAIDRETGVPLLRGAPLAGKLLNEENITFEEVELVVLLQVRRLR